MLSDDPQARLQGLCIATFAYLGRSPACLSLQEAGVHSLSGKLHVTSWLWTPVQVLQAHWDVDEPYCWSALLMSMPPSALKASCLRSSFSFGLLGGVALHRHDQGLKLQRDRSYRIWSGHQCHSLPGSPVLLPQYRTEGRDGAGTVRFESATNVPAKHGLKYHRIS